MWGWFFIANVFFLVYDLLIVIFFCDDVTDNHGVGILYQSYKSGWHRAVILLAPLKLNNNMGAENPKFFCARNKKRDQNVIFEIKV